LRRKGYGQSKDYGQGKGYWMEDLTL
jgi:hypothetical protein